MKLPALALIVMAVLPVGCMVGPRIVLMKNPQTGQVIECRPVGTMYGDLSFGREAKKCADGLEEQGWIRLSPRE